MTNVQKLNEALKPGSAATFRVDEHGGLHIGEVKRPVDAEARLKLQETELKLQEAETRLEERHLREAEAVGMELGGGNAAFAKAFAKGRTVRGRW